MANNYVQGYYDFPKGGREKCKNAKPVTYRSSWEQIVMDWLSVTPSVIEWVSEMPIPYYNSVKGRMARYFVDFIIKYRTKNGDIVTEMLEVKPIGQCRKPIQGKSPKASKRYVAESLTYQINLDKWNAATQYANERGWRFRILTENQLFKG